MWFMNNESDFRRDANPIKHVKQDEMLHYDAKLTHFVVVVFKHTKMFT